MRSLAGGFLSLVRAQKLLWSLALSLRPSVLVLVFVLYQVFHTRLWNGSLSAALLGKRYFETLMRCVVFAPFFETCLPFPAVLFTAAGVAVTVAVIAKDPLCLLSLLLLAVTSCHSLWRSRSSWRPFWRSSWRSASRALHVALLWRCGGKVACFVHFAVLARFDSRCKRCKLLSTPARTCTRRDARTPMRTRTRTRARRKHHTTTNTTDTDTATTARSPPHHRTTTHNYLSPTLPLSQY